MSWRFSPSPEFDPIGASVGRTTVAAVRVRCSHRGVLPLETPPPVMNVTISIAMAKVAAGETRSRDPSCLSNFRFVLTVFRLILQLLSGADEEEHRHRLREQPDHTRFPSARKMCCAYDRCSDEAATLVAMSPAIDTAS